jgi:hypothetical protein
VQLVSVERDGMTMTPEAAGLTVTPPTQSARLEQARRAAEQIAQESLPLDRSLAQLFDALNARTAQVQRLLAVIDGLTKDAGQGGS